MSCALFFLSLEASLRGSGSSAAALRDGTGFPRHYFRIWFFGDSQAGSRIPYKASNTALVRVGRIIDTYLSRNYSVVRELRSEAPA